MATLFVLDVPEFAPVLDAARQWPDVELHAHGQYTAITAARRLAIRRSDTGLRPAIWYGILTGGFVGDVEQFGEEELVVADR